MRTLRLIGGRLSGRWDRAVLICGLATLLSGFLPWWVVRLGGDDATETLVGSAWEASSRWSAAVLATAAAAATWLAWRVVRRWVPLAVRLCVLAWIAGALALTVDQWRDVEPESETFHAAVFADPDEPAWTEPDIGVWLDRDELRSADTDDLYSGAWFGLYCGMALMVLTGVAVVAAGPGEEPVPDLGEDWDTPDNDEPDRDDR